MYSKQNSTFLIKIITFFQIHILKRERLDKQKLKLQLENHDLLHKLNLAKKCLIQLEISNRKSQVPASTFSENTTAENSMKKTIEENSKEGSSAFCEIGRLDLRIGKVIETHKHPDADSLYIEKIDCGEIVPRTVVSGLVKFIPIEEMNQRMVVILCNLKPSKIRGILSEAMVLCAFSIDKVEILAPPIDAIPGDKVLCEGCNSKPDTQLNPKKKIFETISDHLKTNDDLIACYKGKALIVQGKGFVKSQSLRNSFIK